MIDLSILSLSSLPLLQSQPSFLPTTPPPHATITQPAPQAWTPAGAAMNTELVSIFTNENAEFLNMSSPTPGIDMMDWPLTPAQINTLSISSNNYYLTAPVAEHTYYKIEFEMSNNFLDF